MIAIKELVRRNFPRFFNAARRAKDQFLVEVRVIRQVGFRVLFQKGTARSEHWTKELPLQRPLRRQVDGITVTSPAKLRDQLMSDGLAVPEGGHTIYLSPEVIAKTQFSVVLNNYPTDAGLKIIKNVGGVADTDYVHGGDYSRLHRKLTHSHGLLSTVANVLHIEGLGPRLYDLLELQVGDNVWTAYVVKHCEGRAPTVTECENAMSSLRALERRHVLKLSAPGGYDHMDFCCPDCNGNALVEEKTGKFNYVDFQNLLLVNYGRYLEELALAAGADTHFGQKSILRGGRYLYQSIPAVSLAAKRNINDRGAAFVELLRAGKCSVENRLVIDIGCNIGMMIGQYLKMGAAWVHGWDKKTVIAHTEKLLFALGCTRFSLTGGEIRSNQSLETDLPVSARPLLEGCVISYLAIRGHVGWLEALGRVPWCFMIYEGHEGESDTDFEAHMAALKDICNFYIAARRIYEDGDCVARPLAILVREPNF